MDKHFSRSISIRELFFHHESFVYGEYEDEKGESHEDGEGTCLYFIEIISQMCRNFICETLSVVILMSAIHVSWKLERRLHYLQIHLITDAEVLVNQEDLLQQEIPPLCDVIILQSVLLEVRKRSISVFNQVSTLLRNSSKRWVFFANQNFERTYCPF